MFLILFCGLKLLVCNFKSCVRLPPYVSTRGKKFSPKIKKDLVMAGLSHELFHRLEKAKKQGECH